MAQINMNLAAIDGKIEEVARALKLTLAFEAELHDSGRHSLAHVRGMVRDLEERLAALKGMRDSKLGKMGC